MARRVGMRLGSVELAGRAVRYQVTDNDRAHGPEGPGSPPVWAVNIHGFFAGGGMYARESVSLARALGWRVVNPHLPAFGGSAPLEVVTPQGYADAVAAVMDAVGIEHAVLLGHSMGGAFAMAVADAFPDRVLGVVYRDGVATDAWRRERDGLFGRLLRPLVGPGADLADMGAAVLGDVPELVMGRHAAAVARALLPDARHNVRHLLGCVPVARMLLGLDLEDAVRRVRGQHEIPLLAMWGVLDRITPAVTATEFAGVAGCEVVWVIGGHSWMLVEPKIQAGVMTSDPRGHRFLEAVSARRRSVLSLRTPA
ncbi:MAG TPA: alpha/beta hydrolase [Acidimicrobiales bacterium]|nr:alpha/beta hydrolase [Acidimicrobiales bacterium]